MSDSDAIVGPWYIYNSGDRQVRGPLSTSQLQQLASVGVVTPTTLLAATENQNWFPLSDCPELMASILRPKRTIQLQSQVSFEAVNHTHQLPVPDVGQLLQENVASWREAELSKPIQLSEPPATKKWREFAAVFLLGAAGIGLGWLLFPAGPLTNTGLLSFLAIWAAAWFWILFFVLS